MNSTAKILVVDDSTTARQVLVKRLTERGYAALEASDGPTALRLLAEHPFDAVLLDSEMPGMSGLDVLAHIRGTPAPAYLPVLMVTADPDSQSVTAAMEQGASDYVVKPVIFPVLFARLGSLVARRRAEQETQRVLQGLEAEVGRRTGELQRAIEELSSANDELKAIELQLETEMGERMLSEERFRQFVELAPHAKVIVDEAGKIVLVNGQTLARFGYRREELLGQPVEILVPDRFRDRHPGLVRGFFQKPSLRPMGTGRDLFGRRKDGSEFPIDLSLSPVRTTQGLQVIASVVDLTAIRRAEAESRASRQLLQEVIDSLPARIAVRNREGRYQVVNAALAQNYPALKVGQTFQDMASQETGPNPVNPWQARIADMDRQVLEDGHPQQLAEYAETAPSGEVSFRGLAVVPLKDAQGQTTGVVSWSEDITARVQAEARLRTHERLLQTVFDTIPHPIFVLDPELRYLLVNEAWSRLFGMSLAEAKQRTSTHVAGRSAAEHERLIEENRRVLAGEGPIFAEAEPVTVRSGVERTFERHKAPLRDEHGAVVGLVAVLVDVTQRVLAEAESRTRRQMLQNVIDTFPHFISVRDLNGRYRMVNAALAAAHLRLFGASLLGSTPEEAANWNGTRHRVADVMERQARIDRQVLETGKPVRVDSYAFPLHDGDPTIRQQFVFPLLDPEGKVQGVLAWSEDITERLQTERVLRQSAKMEALGRLVSTVSHEFNNTLQIVRGYVELAQSDIAEAELPAQGRTQILADLKQVESAVDRGSRLARQLLATSRSSDLKPERMDLNAHIQDHLAMLRMAVGEMVQVEFLPGAPLPQVLADAGMLDQVLLNLSINARDAMPQGGRVTIDTEAVAVNGAFRAGQPWAKEDRYARIGVRDTGTGMTSEVLERIFEPFFSTKGEEKGPGLGLTVVHGIVNQHNGQILVESELGKGTAFQIYLPLPASRHGA